MKRKLQMMLVAMLVVATVQDQVSAEIQIEPVKNVIVIMTDGTGSTHTTISRWMNGAPLVSEEYVTGAIRTYAADSLITDSAPAATAFATGKKSNTKLVGVLPYRATLPGAEASEEEKYRPFATVLEAAKLKGKSTGLIATSNIQHASPAGYSAHTGNRSDYNDIAMQQVYQDIDVVFGGGRQYLLPEQNGGVRKDGKNLEMTLKERGYGLVKDRQEMKMWSGGKVWGLFAADAMAYEMDRKILNPEEPSLAEMTESALQVLSKNPKGFFLFVEASKVDWASHANDPMGVISDVLAWDESVEIAVNFAKKNPGTLVLAFSDHGNGGMSLGNKKTDTSYDKLPLDDLVLPLKKAQLTGEGVEQVLGEDHSEENIRRVVGKYFGVTDLTSEEIQSIQKSKKGAMNYALGPIISDRSVIGWTTNGHTGEDLFLYAYGPGKYTGTVDNTDLAMIQEKSLGLNLLQVDALLYQEISVSLSSYQLENQITGSEPKLIIRNGSKQAELVYSTDLLRLGGKEIHLDGLTIYIKETGKSYVSQEAVNQIKSYLK